MKYARFIQPMAAKSGKGPFDDPAWLFEIKLDGYRAIAELDRASVRLYSRNGLSFAEDYPEVFSCLKTLGLKAVLDGEIVALDERDRPSFQLLQQVGLDPAVRPYFYVFDVLEFGGRNMRGKPLVGRKRALREAVAGSGCVRYADHVEARGRDFFRLVVERELEGMMAKKMDSLYVDGRRTGDWLKIKNIREQEAVIIGFTEPGGGRKHFGAILLGVYRRGELVYVGHAGTGFSDRTLARLHDLMKPLATAASPVSQKITRHGRVTWIRPELVCSIKFTEWTQEGYLRHPVYLGLRKDKSPQEVIRE